MSGLNCLGLFTLNKAYSSLFAAATVVVIYETLPPQTQEEMTLEYERARLRYEHAQSRIVEHLRKHPSIHTQK